MYRIDLSLVVRGGCRSTGIPVGTFWKDGRPMYERDPGVGQWEATTGAQNWSPRSCGHWYSKADKQNSPP